MDHLDKLEHESIYILREAFNRLENPLEAPQYRISNPV